MTMGSLRLGGYTCEALLGPGGVTETYRAVPLGTTAPAFALKLLRADRGGSDPEVAARFIQAALDLAALAAPGIAPVVEVSTAHDEIFAVSELVAGVDLMGWVESRGVVVQPHLVALLGAQMARTLAFLHGLSSPMVHGGISPGNVIVTADGGVVLLDAGLAAALRALTDNPIEKWFYVAPEVIAGAEATPAADLYSLGAVLFYLLTGAPPFVAETREELGHLARQGMPPAAGVPPLLANVVGKLMAPAPADRPASAADAAVLLSGGKLSRGRPGGAPISALTPTPMVEPLPPPIDLSQLGMRAATADPEPVMLPSVSAILPSVSATFAPVDLDAVPESAVEDSLIAIPSLASLSVPGGQGDKTPVLGVPTGAKPSFGDSFFEISGVNLPVMASELPRPVPAPVPVPEASAESIDIGAGLRATSAAVPIVRKTDPMIPTFAPPDEADTPPLETAREEKAWPRPAASAAERTARPTAGTPVWQPPRTARGGVRRNTQSATVRSTPWKSVVLATAAVVLVAGGALVVMGGMGRSRAEKPVPVAATPTPVTVTVPPQSVVQRPAVPKPAGGPKVPGELKVITSPPGATVWVDGVEKGTSPLTVKIPTGAHRVVLTKPGFKMLREATDTAESGALSRTMPPASPNFGGNIVLDVLCQTRAKYPVFVDGRDTGVLCPAEGLKVPPGNHLIGVFVIPQNKIWSFEREIPDGPAPQRVIFSY